MYIYEKILWTLYVVYLGFALSFMGILPSLEIFYPFYEWFEVATWERDVFAMLFVASLVMPGLLLLVVSDRRHEREKLARWETDPYLREVEELMESPRKLAEAIVAIRQDRRRSGGK